MKVPPCFSEFDPGDSTCQGQVGSPDPELAAPCGARDTCVACSIYLKEQGKPASALFELDADGASAKSREPGLKRVLLTIVDRDGIVNGVPGPKARSKTKAFVGEPDEVIRKFVKVLAKAFGVEVAAGWGDAQEGEMFLVDRLRSSGYATVYRRLKGQKVGLALILFRGKAPELRLSVQPPELAGVTWRPIKDGRFVFAARQLRTRDLLEYARLLPGAMS